MCRWPACLTGPQSLFNYFKQLFAQVTNPPIDPIREELVMSLISYIGTERNILDETPENCHTLKLPHPILTNRDLEKLRRVSSGDLLATTLPTLFRAEDGETGMRHSLQDLSARASHAVQSGYTLLILSDRGIDPTYAPIPALLAMAAVHNRLVQEKTRTQVALIIESGEPREVMHFALLIGYGASAINPYLAIESLHDLKRRGLLPDNVSAEYAEKNFIKAINKGLLKTFSKMGISTLQSYRGAQVFEAVGLNHDLIENYFPRTASRIEGVGLDVLAREALIKHAYAFQPLNESETELVVGGQYQYREGGEYHLLNPLTISKLQQSVRQNNPATFQEYSDLLDEQNRHLCTLRGLLKLKYAEQARAAGRSGAGQGDRQALHHRRHELRVHQQRGARNPGHRHEPPGRHVEHRRGRRGRRALPPRRQRRLAPQRRQAGSQWALRRYHQLFSQRGRNPDQDGPGRKARRGRTIARPQGG